jgi:hypothetical protein
MSQSPLNLHLHHKQGIALQTTATEVLYGGAAGGGKSHLMRVASILWCASIAGLQVYLFRRIEGDLVKNHMEGPKGFRMLLSGLVNSKLVRIVEGEIEFWNGSKIYLCHCKDDKDRFKYQGSEIHVLLIDELTHFSEVVYRFLRGRVRMVGVNLPEQFADMFPRILCGSNPGNLGHHWVKAAFIDSHPPLEAYRTGKDEGGMLRQYIPARLDDNPSMTDDDPTYEDRLSGLGSKALVAALRDGDWDVVDGAYFDCWDTKRHVVEPFAVPHHWIRFRSFDWGSAKPFSVGWWAVADETYRAPDGKVIPRDALVRYREWYGCREPNVGLKLTSVAVAKGIKDRTPKGEDIAYSVGDPAIWIEDGGPSIGEDMSLEGVHFRKADNKRIAGWAQMRNRMIGEDGKPMIFVFSTCTNSIRTVPALQHDEVKAEDVDTDGEDHAADDWRYMCMSRPWASTKPIKKPRPADLWDADDDADDTQNWKTR